MHEKRLFAAAILIGMTLFVGISDYADAHKPIQIGGLGGGESLATAKRITTPDVSQVIYAELTRPRQIVYVKFEAKAGEEIPIQIGVPKLERLTEFRPTAVLIGPGLAGKSTFPGEVPAGMGTAEIAFPNDPNTFFEPFTRTTSWVTPEYRTPLPQTGTYYVAIYEPHNHVGKYFLVVGGREAFSAGDLVKFPEWIRQVRAFYEL